MGERKVVTTELAKCTDSIPKQNTKRLFQGGGRKWLPSKVTAQGAWLNNGYSYNKLPALSALASGGKKWLPSKATARGAWLNNGYSYNKLPAL
eukprot:1150391-Pelagomonas_calceolata.AAC.10